MSKISDIQEILGVQQDGIWGPKSQAALDVAISDSDVVHDGNITASSFADPTDVASYKKWVGIFLERGDDQETAERKALAYGDNGVGVWGDDTTSGSGPSCALQKDWIIEKWGSMENGRHKLVNVTIYGNTVTCTLKDIVEFRNRVDLNPDAVSAFGFVPPILKPASWTWA